jgi:hypothetical protein
VFNVTVVVPDVVPEGSETGEAPSEQVGRYCAPAGDEVNAQVIVTVPTYPVVVATVTVELADSPGDDTDAVVAETVKVPGTSAFTFTFTMLVCVMLPLLPVTVTT